jgi:hypothetical protein
MSNDSKRVVWFGRWVATPLLPQSGEGSQTPTKCGDCVNLRPRGTWYYCAGDGRTIMRCQPASSELKLMDACPMYDRRRG